MKAAVYVGKYPIILVGKISTPVGKVSIQVYRL